MSDVKNSKRKKSRLEAQHMAYAIHKRITAELMASFALSQKRIEAYVESATKGIADISESKERLENLLEAIKKLADEIGLILNMRKTRIVRIDKPFRILQIQYWLIDTGRVVKKINPKSVTRERKKLKAYKRQLDLGKIDFATVENSFKSWIASNYKIMSRLQIDNMFKLYYSLFGRRITWKKKHSRLRWLMEQALKDLPKTETTS